MAKKAAAKRAVADKTEPASVAGVRISHPDRLIYPELGIPKIQLARCYDEIADWMVPHVAGRPLTLVHCPAGLAAPCNYLKHAKACARPRARVSMPVEWDELETRPDRYTLLTVPGRLKRLGVDPWAKYWTSRQRISNASFAAIQRL